MIKKILISALVSMTLVSCAKNEVERESVMAYSMQQQLSKDYDKNDPFIKLYQEMLDEQEKLNLKGYSNYKEYVKTRFFYYKSKFEQFFPNLNVKLVFNDGKDLGNSSRLNGMIEFADNEKTLLDEMYGYCEGGVDTYVFPKQYPYKILSDTYDICELTKVYPKIFNPNDPSKFTPYERKITIDFVILHELAHYTFNQEDDVFYPYWINQVRINIDKEDKNYGNLYHENRADLLALLFLKEEYSNVSPKSFEFFLERLRIWRSQNTFYSLRKKEEYIFYYLYQNLDKYLAKYNIYSKKDIDEVEKELSKLMIKYFKTFNIVKPKNYEGSSFDFLISNIERSMDLTSRYCSKRKEDASFCMSYYYTPVDFFVNSINFSEYKKTKKVILNDKTIEEIKSFIEENNVDLGN